MRIQKHFAEDTILRKAKLLGVEYDKGVNSVKVKLNLLLMTVLIDLIRFIICCLIPGSSPNPWCCRVLHPTKEKNIFTINK